MSTDQIGTRDVIAFRTRPLGFDKTEVRALLSKLLDEHEQALMHIEALRHELSRLRGEGTSTATSQQTEAAQQVERVLASAHRVADEIRKDTERDAAQLLAEAGEKAARVLDAAAVAAKEATDAAAERLRTVEREIERMRATHRRVRSALEAAATAVGATLADVSAFDTLDATLHADEEDTDPLRVFATEATEATKREATENEASEKEMSV